MPLETVLDLTQLPDSMRELTECIGLSHALALVERYGGTRVWIPAKYDPEHSLVTVIGATAAKALIGRYALGQIMIPRCAVAMRAARDEALRARYRAGATARTLAREFRLTEIRIYQIANSMPAVNSTQQTLF